MHLTPHPATIRLKNAKEYWCVCMRWGGRGCIWEPWVSRFPPQWHQVLVQVRTRLNQSSPAQRTRARITAPYDLSQARWALERDPTFSEKLLKSEWARKEGLRRTWSFWSEQLEEWDYNVSVLSSQRNTGQKEGWANDWAQASEAPPHLREHLSHANQAIQSPVPAPSCLRLSLQASVHLP